MTPDDTACEEMLVDHEAERQDIEARMLAEARIARPVERLIAEARKESPVRSRLEELTDLVVRESLLSLAARGNDFLRMVQTQAEERRETFAKRSGARLMKEPITKKRIQEREAAIEAARKVEDEP